MTPEGSALAALVRGQRWFGAKSRELTGGRIADTGVLAPGCRWALLEVEFADGENELYQLPYREAGCGGVELALAEPTLARALLGALRSSATLRTAEGEVAFELTGRLPGDALLTAVRAVGGEQSNSSVVFGERVVLKAYRRLAPGQSAELELLRFLTARGFEHTPELLGSYGYAGAPITASLGILQAFLPGARDGWAEALASLSRPEPFLARLRRLGEVTAHLHAVLASDPADPAFAPEQLDAEAVERAGERAEASARALLADLEPGGPAERVRARADDVLGRLRAAWRAGGSGRVIRQHGDFHLGQVLWANDDWQLLDFEGEPAAPLAERRRKSSPLRDVAGMLRSFAYAAELGRSHGDAAAASWESEARAEFLGGYETRADEALLPPAGAARLQLLTAWELQKALYELRYELDNRPAWVHVPVAGILRLLDG